MLKRQMYGRAGIELLRARLLPLPGSAVYDLSTYSATAGQPMDRRPVIRSIASGALRSLGSRFLASFTPSKGWDRPPLTGTRNVCALNLWKNRGSLRSVDRHFS